MLLSYENNPSIFGVIEDNTDNTKTVILASGVWGFSA